MSRRSQLSNLPECIITQILSCLPTKDAVRTSVLSKDWEYKWTSIYNIDIDDKMLLSKQNIKKTTFVNFVERILLLSLNVKSFRLSYSKSYELSSLTAWMSAVLSRDVESFEVICHYTAVVLPNCLLSCLSLRKLKLDLPCTFRVPSKHCFPNLTELYLHEVEIMMEHSDNDTLKLTFPVLDTFELLGCQWLNVKYVEIYAPALITFVCATRKTSHPGVVKDYSIKIYGPVLKKFQSYGQSLDNLVLKGSPIAYITLVDDYSDNLLEKSGLRVRMLLKEFEGLEKLELSFAVVKAISLSKHGAPFPIYNKLERLVFSSINEIEALLELLHAAPSLKFLVVDLLIWDGYDYDAIESVPSCIISHLEEIKFNNFSGETTELQLAKFVLKNATKLKKVHICNTERIYSPKKKNAIMEKLSVMPKCSACVTIVVSQSQRSHMRG